MRYSSPYEYGPPDPPPYFRILSRRVIKKTRKDHKCVHCSVMIPAGSKCEKIAADTEDGFMAGHAHFYMCPYEEDWP